MAKSENQKGKLLHLQELLYKYTDEEHPMTIQEMIRRLNDKGIKAERKSLYSDLETLTEMDMDIIRIKGKQTGYYLASRTFETAELKLLVDAVQSSKFITHKKSNELIHKLETLCSTYEAKQLQRQVFVSGRVKTMNESIYYNIDKLHTAILQNSSITFQYFEWDLNKNRVLRRDGALYRVSPWALIWNDENYYLVAFDENTNSIRHYRVDKMVHISATGTPRQGRDLFDSFDTASYSQKVFGMFGGTEQAVQLSVPNSYVGVVIDRFGQDLMIVPDEGDRFHTTLRVAVSPQFFSWVFSLPGTKIISPVDVRDQYLAMCRHALDEGQTPH